MTSSISIIQIKYFLSLAKTGSFSAAADHCFVTQSTLSTMIKKMEDQLELLLFDRKTKPISLTQEGKKLLDQFKVIDNEYENLKELIQETKEEFSGTLKIGIIPTLAPFLLPLVLDNLMTGYPNVSFSVNEITTQEILARLKLRDLDIGILSLPIAQKGFVEHSIFQEEFLVYDARGIDKGKKKYKINDIDVNRLWLLEENHCLTNQIEKICELRKKKKLNNKLLFSSGSILSLLEFVNLKKGLTILPKLATLNTSLINPSKVYPLAKPTPARDVGLITHSNFTKKRLLSILQKEIKTSVHKVLGSKKNTTIVKPF